MTAPERLVLTVEELAAMTDLGKSTIRTRVREHGHVFGVRPIPDTGRRVLFSRAAIERALHGEAVAS